MAPELYKIKNSSLSHTSHISSAQQSCGQNLPNRAAETERRPRLGKDGLFQGPGPQGLRNVKQPQRSVSCWSPGLRGGPSWGRVHMLLLTADGRGKLMISPLPPGKGLPATSREGLRKRRRDPKRRNSEFCIITLILQ